MTQPEITDILSACAESLALLQEKKEIKQIMKKAPKRLSKGYSYMAQQQLLRLRFTFEGKRYSVYGNSEKECEQKKEELKEALKNNLNLEKEKITLNDYYNRVWLEEQKKAVKPQTLTMYNTKWNRIKNLIGKKKIVKIQKADVIELQNILLKQGASVASVNGSYRLLKQILKAANADRIIVFNPCNGIKLLKDDKPKAVDTIHRALTREETKIFFQYAEGTTYYHLYRFLLETGARVSEALALTWNDIDTSKREITINKVIARTTQGTIVSQGAKTQKGNRTIPLTDSVRAILQEQKKRNDLLGYKNFDRRIFVNSQGGISTNDAVDSCVKSIIKQANKQTSLQKFSIHALRDTFATRCIEQGMNPQTLKTILGHSSLAMTMDLYAHVMPNTKYEEISKIRIS